MKKAILLIMIPILMAGCNPSDTSTTETVAAPSTDTPEPTVTSEPTATPVPRDLTFDEIELQLSEWFEADIVYLFDFSDEIEIYGAINSKITGSTIILGKTQNNNLSSIQMSFDDTNTESGFAQQDRFYDMYLTKYVSSEAAAWVKLNVDETKNGSLEKIFGTPFGTVEMKFSRSEESPDSLVLYMRYSDAK